VPTPWNTASTTIQHHAPSPARAVGMRVTGTP
jgi:hypothetical protein